METDSGAAKQQGGDFSEVMSDPAFLQDVLQSLPGVDPDSDVVKEAVKKATKNKEDKDGDKKE